MLGTIVGMLLECKFKAFLTRFRQISDMRFITTHPIHVKLLSAILITFLVRRDLIIFKHFAGAVPVGVWA